MYFVVVFFALVIVCHWFFSFFSLFISNKSKKPVGNEAAASILVVYELACVADVAMWRLFD